MLIEALDISLQLKGVIVDSSLWGPLWRFYALFMSFLPLN
jgi:hypothetical protein